MSGKDVRVGWMEGLQAVQPRGRMIWKIFECYKDPASFSTPVQLTPRPFTSGHCEMVHVPRKWSDYASHRRQNAWQEQEGRHSASHDSESTEVAGVFRWHMQQSLVWPWWAHPMARDFPGFDVSRLFRMGVRQVTCVRTKTTEWRWPPTEDHRGLCTHHPGNAAPHVLQLVRVIWTVPHPPWRSCWVLMCWETKVVSLLHVYIPLTGNKVDFFMQRFRFFLWHLKRITCISVLQRAVDTGRCYLLSSRVLHFQVALSNAITTIPSKDTCRNKFMSLLHCNNFILTSVGHSPLGISSDHYRKIRIHLKIQNILWLIATKWLHWN
jgi:hypothetical protein